VLCRLRHEDGVPFRAMCRNEEQIRRQLTQGIEVVCLMAQYGAIASELAAVDVAKEGCRLSGRSPFCFVDCAGRPHHALAYWSGKQHSEESRDVKSNCQDASPRIRNCQTKFEP
jgi:hypothetical protein